MSTVKCPEYDCDFSCRSDNMVRHLKTVHFFDQEKISNYKLSYVSTKSRNKSGSSWICPVCQHQCSTKNGIIGHIKTKHENEKSEALKNIKQEEESRPDLEIKHHENEPKCEKSRLSCSEPNCQTKLPTRKKLFEHLQTEHSKGTDFTIETGEFENYEKFNKWLCLRKEETCSTFRMANSYKDGNIIYESYVCSHEGSYETKGTRRIGHASKKITDSDKCSAFYKIHKKDEKITVVESCFYHSAHELYPSLQRLTDVQIQVLVGMMKTGLNDRQIKEQCRVNYRPNNRLNSVVTDDLRYLRETHMLYPGRLHSNDLTSVKMRAELNNEKDGIRKFLMPTDATGKGFKMVIMTPEQVKLLKQHSHLGVVADDTHHVTQYDMKLTTLLVANENSRGIPVGFLLSDSTTSLDVEYLFECIKDVYPEFQPAVFMTDQANVFWNAYVKVFPEASKKTKRRYP